MINALFVLIVFLLQLNKDSLHVKWPISARVNVTYDEITQEVNFVRDIDAVAVYSIVFFKFLIFLTLSVDNRATQLRSRNTRCPL